MLPQDSTVADMFRLLVLFCVSATAFGALPHGWKICSKVDPKYSECIGTEIQKAIKDLAGGDKSLGVQPLDPLRINYMQVGKGGGPVSMELYLTNSDSYGLKDIQVKNARNDWKTMSIQVFIPKLVVISNYRVDGQILILPIEGQGKGNLTFEQLSVDTEIKWKRITKGGTEYFQMESITVPLNPKILHITLENLFNGNKALGDNMNSFLNQNWELILDELRTPVSEALSVIFTKIANEVLGKIPAKVIDV